MSVWVYHSGMEDQVKSPLFPTGIGSGDLDPVLSSVNPNSGTYHMRVPHTSNTAYSFSRGDDFSTPAVGDTMLLGAALCWEGDIEGNLRFGIFGSTNSSPAFAGFTIAVDTGVIRAGVGNDSAFTDTVKWTSAPGAWVEGDYIDLEIWWDPDNSSGGWAFGVNGVEVFSETGVDTNPGAGSFNGDWGIVIASDALNGSGFTAELDIDDVRAGHLFTGLQGPMEHEWLAVDSSAESDGLGSDGNSVDNYLLVDETPFSATDYVDLQAAADRERYGFANRTLTGDIACVSVVCQAQTPTGSSTANTFLLSNATEEAGDSLILGAGSTVFRQYVELDPDTAAAWTDGGLNAATVGVERTV